MYCQHLKLGNVTRQRYFVEGISFANLFLISDSIKLVHISLDREKLVLLPWFL